MWHVRIFRGCCVGVVFLEQPHTYIFAGAGHTFPYLKKMLFHSSKSTNFIGFFYVGCYFLFVVKILLGRKQKNRNKPKKFLT